MRKHVGRPAYDPQYRPAFFRYKAAEQHAAMDEVKLFDPFSRFMRDHVSGNSAGPSTSAIEAPQHAEVSASAVTERRGIIIIIHVLRTLKAVDGRVEFGRMCALIPRL